jgi:hypothetical protein
VAHIRGEREVRDLSDVDEANVTLQARCRGVSIQVVRESGQKGWVTALVWIAPEQRDLGIRLRRDLAPHTPAAWLCFAEHPDGDEDANKPSPMSVFQVPDDAEIVVR